MRTVSFAETFHVEHSFDFAHKQKGKIGSRRSIRRKHVSTRNIKEENRASVKVA